MKMVKTSDNSRIEVWKGDYINNTDNRRHPEDAVDKVEIIQIEPGNATDDYIVEVKNKEDQSKTNDLIFATGKLSAMSIIVNRLKEECDNPNRDWYGTAVYSQIRDVLCDIEEEFKKEVDDAAGETVSK